VLRAGPERVAGSLGKLVYANATPTTNLVPARSGPDHAMPLARRLVRALFASGSDLFKACWKLCLSPHRQAAE